MSDKATGIFEENDECRPDHPERKRPDDDPCSFTIRHIKRALLERPFENRFVRLGSTAAANARPNRKVASCGDGGDNKACHEVQEGHGQENEES